MSYFLIMLQGGADKSLAQTNSDVVGQNRLCCWKELSVHVLNCKSFHVTKAERKRVK
jgi:hypothetical protein